MKAAGEQWFVVGEAQDGGGKGKEVAPSQSLTVPGATSALLGLRGVFQEWFIDPRPPLLLDEITETSAHIPGQG